MTRKPFTLDFVRALARTLPGVEESAGRGAPSLKVRGRLLACPAIHKSAEPDSLVVKIGFDQRAELLAADPDVYYVTSHYSKYPSILVRLSRIQPRTGQLTGLRKLHRSPPNLAGWAAGGTLKRRAGVMGYLKSILAGIVGATATGLLAFGYQIYQSFHPSEIDVHVTDFYFPAWIPHRVVYKAMDLWFRARSNATLLLILGAFVISFYWAHRQSCIRAS